MSFGKNLVQNKKDKDARTPYLKGGDTALSIYLDIFIALIPAAVWGVIAFGWQAAVNMAASVIGAEIGECIARFVLRRRPGGFLSSAVIGLLIPMCLPPSVKFWIPSAGAFVAVLGVKYLLGDIKLGTGRLGDYLSSVPLVWCFLRVIFPDTGVYTKPFSGGSETVEGVLSVLKRGEVPTTPVADLLLGKCAGTVGEISALILIFGGIYLLWRRVINWRVPVAFVGTAAVLTLAFPLGVDRIGMMTGNLLSGGLIFGAVFVAAVPGVAPMTDRGRFIFGAGCGALTVLFRYYGVYPEGVPFALLVMTLLSPLIDRIAAPSPFGVNKRSR